MDTASNQPDSDGYKAARRFLRIFSLCVAVIAIIVATINLVAWRYMLRDDNQAIVQLMSGWGRLYKPILYDEIEPEIAVFGASWARDAFDPISSGRLLGRRLFNHGVSGGSAYETRRFADSALSNPNLQVAIINLDSFHSKDTDALFSYGFDESILNVDADHHRNPFVGLRRAYSLALGGWSVGANVELISTILERDRGLARPDYLDSYQQADQTQFHLEKFRRRIFPPVGSTVTVTPGSPAQAQLRTERLELETTIRDFCDAGVDIYAYFTPSHIRKQTCDPGASEALITLDFLRRQQRSCAARIHYFDFSYPNAITLEGVLTPVRASRYYRPDAHPRPTVGLAMAASMFGKPFPAGTPPALSQDFGVDLLDHADAEGWLLKRARRCLGDWGEDGYAAFVEGLASP
jgi:hypothetical protein